MLDVAELAYRVLRPVMLEFQVLDDSGALVRTIRREHAGIGVEASVTWDGRDDDGVPAPDGTYALRVQAYEFALVLDRTSPEASFEMASPASSTTA